MAPRPRVLALFLAAGCAAPRPSMDWIEVRGSDLVRAGTGERFVAWGFNYDHDRGGRLLEDYWEEEWGTVLEDLREMKDLGANVVRVHLQTGRFLRGPDEVDERALARLGRLVVAAEEVGLYLDVTGLGCYHADEVPDWYDALDEAGRWAAQARFWEGVARTCAPSPAVLCYDLMNEPILPGREPETGWLTGELDGKHFVQRIALDLAGRTRREVAREWVARLTSAIRRHDRRHLVTVGVIPWALTFPGAEPLFYAPEVRGPLDLVSVHFYPERGRVDEALEALRVYAVGLPLLVEETFPLRCGVDELDRFVEGSREVADGWIGFYWGRTPEGLAEEEGIPAALTRTWLEYFREQADGHGPRE